MININLIAERRARKLREMTIIRVGFLSLVFLAIFVVLLNMYAGYQQISARSDQSLANREIAQLQPQYEALQKIQLEIRDREPVVKLLEQVQVSEGAWMTIFTDLSIITPRSVALSGVSASADDKGVGLRIGGRAQDQSTVAAFMEALRQQTGWAGTPELKSLTSDATGKDGKASKLAVRFELQVPVRGLVGGNL